MVSATKQLVADLLPPLVLRGLRLLRSRRSDQARNSRFLEFEGDYKTFAEAKAHSVGYENKIVGERYAKNLFSLASNTEPREIDSRFQQVHSALLYVVDRLSADGMISVLDVGGGNGAYGFTMRQLSRHHQFNWTVLEARHVAEACKGVTDTVQFISEWDAVTKNDVTLISGTLQYLESPYEILMQAAEHSDWIILTRLPIQNSDSDKVVIQHVPPQLYKGSMPMYCFSEKMIRSEIGKIGEIVLSWEVPADSRSWTAYGFEARGYLIQVSPTDIEL